MAEGDEGKKRDPRFDVSGALHDVGNALTVLLGWIAEARSPDLPAEHREHAFAVIERQARIARSIARRAVGAEVLSTEGPAAATVAEVIDSVSALAQKRHVTFDKQGDAAETNIDRAGDFGQVLMNLCLNAVAFTPDGSKVVVNVATDPRGVVVDVIDQGAGVPASRAEDIFSGESTRPGGAGVGLRHARALARAAGGDLTLVKPVAGAVGARFRIEWPRADRLPKAPMSFTGLALFASHKMLLVEDDDAVIELVETALTAKGATVTVAKTLAACDAALASGGFDCAVIDLSPLGKDASSTFTKLDAMSLPLVLISGNVDNAPPLGGDARIVRKPFELKELLDALAALLAESRR